MTSAHLITAVVVTFNRAALLERCLTALDAQSYAPDRILLIDNASNDDTQSLAARWASEDPAKRQYIRLDENLGGAGGFARGIEEGLSRGKGWLWLMDDDAEPESHALEEVLRAANSTANIFGSLARSGDATSWTTTLLMPSGELAVDRVDDVPEIAEVKSLPFLGFLVHSDLVQKMGLPDAGYFIAGDDIEYCVRARAQGARIFIVGRSLIGHPSAARGQATLMGVSVAYLSLPAWKRYYDTRNRILTARRHRGLTGWVAVTLSTVWRFGLALTRESDRGAQARATLGGLIDGTLGRKGRRHGNWGIGP